MVDDTPKSIYAMTKRQNELEAYVVSNSTDMKITGLRFFSVYGNGEDQTWHHGFCKSYAPKRTCSFYIAADYANETLPT